MTRHRRRAGTVVAAIIALVATHLVTIAVAPVASATTITVTTSAESGPGSLRAAFDEANASPGDDTIVLDPSQGEYELCGSPLSHRQATRLTLEGHGSVIRQVCIGGIFHGERPAGTLHLEDVAVSGGVGVTSAPTSAGAISSQGHLELVRVTLRDNRSEATAGAIEAWGSLDIVDSTIIDNSGPTGGISAASNTVITGSTIADNTGWGLLAIGTGAPAEVVVRIETSTITGNDLGVGLDAYSGTVALDLRYTTLTDNTSDPERPTDLILSSYEPPSHLPPAVPPSVVARGSAIGSCSLGTGSLASAGSNVGDIGGCGLWTPGDRGAWGDMDLGPLGDHGGLTPTRVPQPGSPLIDAIPNCIGAGVPVSDQRGEPRPMGAGCDAGAVEAPGPLLLDVTSLTDGAPGSLRARVDEANASPGPDIVRLPPAAEVTLDLCGAPEDANASGDLDATDSEGLTLLGELSEVVQSCPDGLLHASAGNLAVRGFGALRGGAIVGKRIELYGATVRDVPGTAIIGTEVYTEDVVVRDNGAGIEAPQMFINETQVLANTGFGLRAGSPCGSGRYAFVHTSLVQGNGQGIVSGGTDIWWSTIADNGPAAVGGGILAARLSVNTSTVVGNTATNSGGGISIADCGYDTVDLTMATVADNLAPAGSNVDSASDDTLRVNYSIIGGSATTGPGCTSPASASVGSFGSDLSCGLDDPASIGGGGDPLLGPLAWAPGHGMTLTREPLPGSPVIDEGRGCTAFGDIDQRHAPRESGGFCDIGAVELQVPPRFFDVEYDHPFNWAVECVADLGVSSGFPDGSFRPTTSITRRAAAVWLHRLYGSPAPSGSSPFADVPPGHPDAAAVTWLSESGITTGYPDGLFHPNSKVTRSAMITWLWRAAGEPPPGPVPPGATFPDVPPGHPAYTPLVWAVNTSITTGTWWGFAFKPAKPVSRQAAAVWLCQYEYQIGV